MEQKREQVTQLEAKQKSLREGSKPLFDEWIKRPELLNELLSKHKPLDGLQLHMPLDEGPSDFVHLVAGGVTQRKPIPAGAAWADGHIARQAWVNAEAGSFQLPDIGNFDKQDAFSYGAWLLVPPNANGAVFARMNEAEDFRGWDLWLQNGQIASHIISAWPRTL